MSVSNVNTNFSKIYSGKLTTPLLFDILIATSPSLYHSTLSDQLIMLILVKIQTFDFLTTTND